MGPKAKGKAKGKGKPKAEKKAAKNEVDPVDEAEEAERKALCQEADRTFKRSVKEDHDFAEFQQQREKLNYFWIVEKKNLENKRALLRNKERELQDLEEKQQVEIKIYKQRVKHLLHEHQNDITLNKTEAQASLKVAQDEHRSDQAHLKVDQRAIAQQLKEAELNHQAFLNNLKHEQDVSLTNLRDEFDRRTSEVHKAFEKRMRVIRERLEVKRRQETTQIEERKNAQIESLMKSHEKAFAEIKNYYNDITHNNLDLIKTLKEQVGEMRKKEQQDEKMMFEIAQENKRMSEPLRRAREDVETLRTSLEQYKAEKEQLRQAKAKLLVVDDEHTALKWEQEVLEQRFAIVKKERDDIYQQFRASINDVQQKAGFKNLLLERKLDALQDEGEKYDAYVNEILKASDLDESLAQQVRGKLDSVIQGKSSIVRDIETETSRIKAAHAKLVSSYEATMQEFGVPPSEVGFKPAVRSAGAKRNKNVTSAGGIALRA